MHAAAEFRRDWAEDQAECARLIVDLLFKATGLSRIVRTAPSVIVGDGNWISFTAGQAVSLEDVLGLPESSERLGFVRDLFRRRSRARSRTNPSLHLTNLGSGEALRGHVDAFYWGRNPLRHAGEFFRKRTLAPSELLLRVTRSRDVDCGVELADRVADEAVKRRKPRG